MQNNGKEDMSTTVHQGTVKDRKKEKEGNDSDDIMYVKFKIFLQVVHISLLLLSKRHIH